jgi:CHAD domain-containing protein
MKPEPVSQARFQEAFVSARVRTERAIRACLKRPTPEAIHEARIAIRKLTAVVSLMPKGFRRDGKTVKTMKALRLFYNNCAKIRDIDAMMGALSADTAFDDLKEVVASLERRRSALLARVLSSGDKARGLVFPRQADDTRRRLSKRLNKLLVKGAGRAGDLYRVAASGEEKVAELHKLRKECRHIMYLLDSAKEDAKVKSVKTDLEDAREKLGSIRDDDLLLGVLRGARDSNPVEVAVSAGRLAKYRKFFASQTAQGKRPKLLGSILSLT